MLAILFINFKLLFKFRIVLLNFKFGIGSLVIVRVKFIQKNYKVNLRGLFLKVLCNFPLQITFINSFFTVYFKLVNSLKLYNLLNLSVWLYK